MMLFSPSHDTMYCLFLINRDFFYFFNNYALFVIVFFMVKFMKLDLQRKLVRISDNYYE